MKTEYSLRYTSLGAVFAFVGILIIGQLIRFQFSPSKPDLIDNELNYYWSWKILTPERGTIYDRWGHVLAGNTTVYEVGVDLSVVKNPESIALACSVVLGLDYYQVLTIASQPVSEDARYIVLDNYVPPEKIGELESLIEELKNSEQQSPDKNGNPHSLRGLTFSPHLDRYYPEREFAANLLGFYSRDEIGYYGIEQRFDRLLSGIKKPVKIPRDPNLAFEEMPEVPDGASLILTIDREIQAAVEAILDQALQDSGAKNGTIIVMQPENGEILAMASTPRIDLNEYWRLDEYFAERQAYNLAVDSYEPGSVFKVFTMGAAIDADVVEPDTVFVDTGYIEVGGIGITNWDGGAWGPQTMIGCLQHSLNVCLAHVGTLLGPGLFYDYMQKFDFGRSTGIELADETIGRLKLPGDDDWYAADLGTNSFGQGVAVTPLQMIKAISAFANHGKMVVPHLVYATVKGDRQYVTPTHIAGTPVTPETAQTITDMLAISLEQEASSALVEGYRVAGKTGTAEIPGEYGYTSSLTNASFVGWGPVDDPQFIVYIWLQEPTVAPWGSVVAAPVFSQVVQRLVVLMNIPPDAVRASLTTP
jgi:cell division protein FtsI/penicillin-binding protein 2